MPATSSAPPLIDIGANLGHDSFRDDLDAVLLRARNSGITHILVTGSDLHSTAQAAQLRDKHPETLSFTAGVHPHVAKSCTTEQLAKIKSIALEQNACAIGETGLDFNRDYSPRSDQEEIFRAQLQIACELNKPVFLHQRDAHSRFLPILSQYRDKLVGGVVHCFTGNKQELFSYLDLDMHIGITGWICDERRGIPLQSFIHEIPAQRLLLETDAPYLLPRSIRPRPKSRRNEPHHLTEVLATVASCLDSTVLRIATQTTDNAIKLFGLDCRIALTQ